VDLRAVCRPAVNAVIALAWATTAFGQAAEDPRPRPDLEPERVAGEVVLGATAGYLGYFAGRFVGVRVAELFAIESSGRRSAVINGFGYAAAGASTAGAVYGIGSIDGQTGEFGTTLLGAGVGFTVAVLVNQFVFRPRETPESSGSRAVRLAAEVVEVMLPAIGATIAFNSTRRYAR
jgi:hypothetical protein